MSIDPRVRERPSNQEEFLETRLFRASEPCLIREFRGVLKNIQKETEQLMSHLDEEVYWRSENNFGWEPPYPMDFKEDFDQTGMDAYEYPEWNRHKAVFGINPSLFQLVDQTINADYRREDKIQAIMEKYAPNWWFEFCEGQGSLWSVPEVLRAVLFSHATTKLIAKPNVFWKWEHGVESSDFGGKKMKTIPPKKRIDGGAEWGMDMTDNDEFN